MINIISPLILCRSLPFPDTLIRTLTYTWKLNLSANANFTTVLLKIGFQRRQRLSFSSWYFLRRSLYSWTSRILRSRCTLQREKKLQAVWDPGENVGASFRKFRKQRPNAVRKSLFAAIAWVFCKNAWIKKTSQIYLFTSIMAKHIENLSFSFVYKYYCHIFSLMSTIYTINKSTSRFSPQMKKKVNTRTPKNTNKNLELDECRGISERSREFSLGAYIKPCAII